MSRVEEQISEQFHRWELRGRGWRLYDRPVHPEPPFVRFDGHYLPDEPVPNDGRRSTFLSSLVQRLSRGLATDNLAPPVIPPPEEEPDPIPLVRDPLTEFQASLPDKLDIPKEAFEQFLSNLSLCREPISFEVVGVPERVSIQFVAGEHDALLVRRQLRAYFPEAPFVPKENALEEAWNTCSGDEELVVEFGLGREFMLSLASGKLDPFVGIVGALSELQSSEFGLFQVSWQPVNNPWAESIVRSVTHEDRKPFFVNMPELAKAAEGKVSKMLYAAVVRVATKAESFERALQLASDMAGSLRVFSNPQGNELIPLRNDEYPIADHIEDMLCRQSRRCGMLLSSDELTGFVHLPSSAVRSPVLERDSGKTKTAPTIVRNARGLVLGSNVHLDESSAVRLTPEQRTRHVHVIGASGTGKSTLLFNLIRQDIEDGQGIAVLDPHGDLVDKILGIIPPNRIDDVILVDPSDEEYSIGFNILSAHSDHEKTLLASDLVSVFQRLSTSWGDQMQSVLQNAILAFLNSSRGGTLADLRRFFVESSFRNEFLKSVSDSNVLYYWHKGFPHLSGNKSIGPVLTRLEMFLAQRPIAHMVSQPENRLDFGEIMDTGKIFLAKLPEGLLGRENSYLLGALLVSKFQQLVMARQAKKIAARRDFWIFIDEFANFITPTMAEILSSARKYRIGLTLAHHELHQLQRSSEVASAVMTHPYTRVVFRVGDDDAKKLAEGFSFFEPADLKNLETGQAVCRVERSDFDFNLSVPLPEMPDEATTADRLNAVIAASRTKYGTPRADIEAMLRQAWEVENVKSAATKPKSAPPDEPPGPPAIQPTVPLQPAPSSGLPKPSEPPGDTDSEKKIPEVSRTASQTVPTAPDLAVEQKSKPARDLGRGGELHKTIQGRIETEARSLGFTSDREKTIRSVNEAADVVVEHGEFALAVEIALTTTTNHEFGNVKKCLGSGFARVAVVSPSKERLRQIAGAVQAGLGPKESAKVSYHTPDDFIAHLKTLARQMKPEAEPLMPGERKSHGRTVRRHTPKLSDIEQKEREDAINSVLRDTMRGKKT